MRRIAPIILLLVAGACAAVPTAPEPSARFGGPGMLGGGGRSDDGVVGMGSGG